MTRSPLGRVMTLWWTTGDWSARRGAMPVRRKHRQFMHVLGDARTAEGLD